MKFFAKLFLCSVLVLTAALSLAEYYTASTSLDNAVRRQVANGLQQHQLVKYAIQSGMLTAARGSALNADALEEIAGQTVHAMSVYLTLSETDGEELYTNVSYSFQTEMGEDGYISYQIVEEPDESNWLVISSTFSQSGYQLVLTTVEEVNELFIEARQLQERCQRVFLIATISGSALILVVSWLLTRPIKRLEEASRAFARGDYDLRLTTRSRDEIGDLTRTYNEMAQTIQEKIDQLEQAVRQREDFVANFAHELKTPMTSIIGYADTLYQKQLTPAQVHEASGYIVNEGLRLEALSFKLLELITLERQDFLLEEMDLKELLRDVEETAFPSALKRKVKLRVEAEEGYARVEYDLFKTLLLNLLDNAFKSGGTQVTLRGWAVGDRYLIDITDNGRGIPADQLQRITEAFYMVDKSRSRKEHGAGLGLALCAKIAAIHSTSLHYDSVEGQGTSVEVALKRCEREVED